jgi:hypothetical protein
MIAQVELRERQPILSQSLCDSDAQFGKVVIASEHNLDERTTLLSQGTIKFSIIAQHPFKSPLIYQFLHCYQQIHGHFALRV